MTHEAYMNILSRRVHPPPKKKILERGTKVAVGAVLIQGGTKVAVGVIIIRGGTKVAVAIVIV